MKYRTISSDKILVLNLFGGFKIDVPCNINGVIHAYLTF